DFNTGSSAVRSVPDVDDIQLSAVSINLSQVAISCETWNGKDPTAYKDVPPVAMLLIRRNGIELGSMAPPATGKFMFGNGSNGQDYRTFSGPLPGQPTDDDIDILVVIPALTVTEAEEGYFTKVPDWEKEGTLITPVSIKVGTENFKLTIDTDDVNAGTKTVDGKIIVTLPAQ
ncbi:MAG: hypothetical protein LBD86_06195, partial [Spirochaetaceae bacterium]|nr:hypothetical protein [Spirochaetaceae bacterium]